MTCPRDNVEMQLLVDVDQWVCPDCGMVCRNEGAES